MEIKIINGRELNSENIIEKMDELKNYLIDLSFVIKEDTRLMEGLRILSIAQDEIKMNS